MKKKSFIERFGAGIACICFALTCVFGGIAAGFMPKKSSSADTETEVVDTSVYLNAKTAASAKTKLNAPKGAYCSAAWTPQTWEGDVTDLAGDCIWTDGNKYYYSYNESQYYLDTDGVTWREQTWLGDFTYIEGNYIWTDGHKYYYSYRNEQYYLDTDGVTWREQTWLGDFTYIEGDYIWTDGNKYYYSDYNYQYYLDTDGVTWQEQTWEGDLTHLYGNYIWTDGHQYYYSNSSYNNVDQYCLDIDNGVWKAIGKFVWTGYEGFDDLLSFNGRSFWTDGNKIYCYVYTYEVRETVCLLLYLDMDEYTFKIPTKLNMQPGYVFRNSYYYEWNIWTDGTDIYYSNGNLQYKLEIVDHEYENQIIAPTCTSQGYTKHTCTVCGDSYNSDYIDALDHNYESEITTAPTCVDAGIKTFTCTVCEHSYTKDIPANGHQYGTATLTQAPTCTSTGVISQICAVCNDELSTTVNVVPSAHHYDTTKVPATCTTEGYTTYTCSRCGDHYDADIVAKKDHVFNEEDWVEIAHPDCSNSGAEQCKCANCDYVTTRDLATNAEHDLPDTWTVVTPATCVTDGLEKKQCSRCEYFESEKIDATGHDCEAHVTDPTCTSIGYTTYQCKNCEYSYVDNKVHKLPHNYGEWEITSEASCLQTGEQKRVCAGCGCFETQTIDALGHDDQKEVVAPTCTTAGYIKHTCARCNDTYNSDETVKAAHTYGEWTQTLAPTVDEPGLEQRTCTVCGDIQGREIAKLEPTPQPENEFPVVPVVAGSAAAVALIAGIAVTAVVLSKKHE